MNIYPLKTMRWQVIPGNKQKNRSLMPAPPPLFTMGRTRSQNFGILIKNKDPEVKNKGPEVKNKGPEVKNKGSEVKNKGPEVKNKGSEVKNTHSNLNKPRVNRFDNYSSVASAVKRVLPIPELPDISGSGLDSVIIIPYRKREKHLEYFIKNTVPLLQKHIPNGKVVIIEQDWANKLFNRGCLLNIGVNEYKNLAHHLITHDIDINPTEATILKYYLDNIPRDNIQGIYTSPCNTLGGIIKMPINTFFKINGFPNYIWGWGHEDKALQNRAEFKKISIKKKILSNDPNRNKYFKIFNDIKDRNSYKGTSHFKRINNESNLLASGLNNLSYKIIKRENITEYVELIKISI